MQSTNGGPSPRDLWFYRLFPITAGTVWFTTLLILLVYWLASGRPVYPSQVNPYVAFISDIGSFELQPLFIIGGVISAATLFITFCVVHYTLHWRHLPGRDGQDWQYSKSFSILACIFELIGCPSQIGLTVFDNYSHPNVHRLLLFLALAGTALAALCTTIAFWDIMRQEDSKRNEPLRRAVIVSNFFFLLEFGLGVVFTALIWTGFYRICGIVEWVMAFWFTFYFLAFVGFLVVPEETQGDVDEETPLLR